MKSGRLRVHLELDNQLERKMEEAEAMQLKARVAQLEVELKEKQSSLDRMAGECAEMKQLLNIPSMTQNQSLSTQVQMHQEAQAVQQQMPAAIAQAATTQQQKQENPIKKLKDRRFTDIGFLLLIVALWVCMTAIGCDSIRKGRPWTLVAPMDSEGLLCGYQSAVKNRPYLYFIDDDLNGACVNSCPSTDVEPDTWKDLICLEGVTISGVVEPDLLIQNRLCQQQYASKQRFYRCVFEDVKRAERHDFTESMSFVERFAADIFTCRHYVFGLGFSVSLVIGFLLLWLIQIPNPLLNWVWGGAICILCGCWLGLSAWMLVTSDAWRKERPQVHNAYEVTGLEVLGWILFCMLFLFLCILTALRKHIGVACNVVRETCYCVKAMPVVLFMPLVQIIGYLLFMLPWAMYAAYTAGLGTVTVIKEEPHGDLGIYYYRSKKILSLAVVERGWFLLFCFLWTFQFILTLAKIGLGYFFAVCYFSKSKQIDRKIWPGVFKIMFLHSGTAAMGSLVHLFVKYPRGVIMSFKKKEWFKDCLVGKCCTWAAGTCIKHLDQSAFVQTSIYGYNFNDGTQQSFQLLFQHAEQLASITYFSEVLATLGKLIISGTTTFFVYTAIATKLQDQVHSLIVPCILVLVLSWLLAIMFMNTLHMGIISLFQCITILRETCEEKDHAPENQL